MSTKFMRPRGVLGSDAQDAIGLGRYIDMHGIAERVRYGGDQHVLVFGPNNKGKGSRILIPNLLQMRGNRSIVVVDPKGELAAVTAPFRRSLGKVVILNPFGVLVDEPGYEDLRSDGFNPLAHLDPNRRSFNSDAALMAEALIDVNEKDPHWGSSGRTMTAAMIMYATMEARSLGIAPTIERVRELLCLPSERGDRSKGLLPVGVPRVADRMTEMGHAGLANKASQFTEWTDEVQSIASTARVQTESLDDDEVAADMKRGDFDFRTIKEEPTTVYLILPPTMMSRHAKWLRLCLTAALQASLRPRRRGEPRVLFMMDEFFSLGRLEIIETTWALARGYGVSMMLACQDIWQLRKLYGDMWENFVGMAGAVVNFAPNDQSTAKWLSERAGETTRIVESSTFSHGYNGGQGNSPTSNGHSGWSSGTSHSVSTIRTPLVAPNKLFGLKAGFTLTTLDGLSQPIPGYAPGYYDIRQCWLVARDNPYYAGSA